MNTEEVIHGLKFWECGKCEHKNEENCGYDGEPDCAIHMTIKALEKQIPKKPEEVTRFKVVKIGQCQICGMTVSRADNYCHWCGNMIDWSEVDR